ASYHKPGTDAALEPSYIPRRPVIRFHRRGCDSDKTFLDRSVWLWRRNWNRNGNDRLSRRARPRWPRLLPRNLWFNRRRRGGAVLRVQKRRKQKANVNNNNKTLHGRKGGKLKQRNRKSRFGFEFAIGFVAQNDT